MVIQIHSLVVEFPGFAYIWKCKLSFDLIFGKGSQTQRRGGTVLICDTVREEKAPCFPRHRESATGDSSHGLLHMLRRKAAGHFCASLLGIGRKWRKGRKPCRWEERPPETTYAHPLKAHLWLDPGVGKEVVHCLGQEELGRRAHLHGREKVIRVSFELMSFLALKIFTSIY